MQANNLFQQYKAQAVSTLSKEEILIELLSETIKQIHVAMNSIEDRNFEAANNSMKKSTTILSTLSYYLDPGYEITAQLRPLYSFMIDELIAANLRKDRKRLDDVLFLVTELKDAFSQAYKSIKDSASSNQSKVGGV